MRRTSNLNQLKREVSLKPDLNGLELSIQQERPYYKETSNKNIAEKVFLKRLIFNYSVAHVLITVESIDPTALTHEDSISSIFSLHYFAKPFKCRLNITSEKVGV